MDLDDRIRNNLEVSNSVLTTFQDWDKAAKNLEQHDLPKPLNTTGTRAYFYVLMYALARARQNLEATVSLSKAGFGPQAMMVARANFELCVTVDYIYKDILGRILQYLAFDAIERGKHVFNIEKWGHLYPNVRQTLTDEYAVKAKAAYHKAIAGHKGNKSSWSGKSLKEMCKELGPAYESKYDIEYLMLCRQSHNAVTQLDEHLNISESGTPEVMFSGSPEWGRAAESTAVKYHQGILILFANGVSNLLKADSKVIDDLVRQIQPQPELGEGGPTGAILS